MLSAVLQIVDDTPFKGQRRSNIQNNQFKYIGISHRKVEDEYCFYFVFAY